MSSEHLSTCRFKRAYVTKNVPLDDLLVDPSRQAYQGDLALFRVTDLKRQTRLETPEGRRAFLYANDLILGVVGKRYSTKHYSGFELPERSAQLLTTSGIIGHANMKAGNIKAPTELNLIGTVVNPSGRTVNVRDYRLLSARSHLISTHSPVLLVVGSDMDSGKTTLASAVIKGFSRTGHKVYAFKLTGSASGPDYWKMSDAGAQHTSDFLDGGWVSTCGLKTKVLLSLLNDALADASERASDLIVIELADGILQPETASLLNSVRLKRSVSGVLLAAESALSAVFASETITRLGYTLTGVGGLFTQYPLAIEEFCSQASIPVLTPQLLESTSGAQMIGTALRLNPLYDKNGTNYD